MTTAARRSLPWAKILIVAVPVWLLVSGGVGLYLHFHYQEKERQEQQHAYRKDINAKSLADDFSKISSWVGARHHQTAEARSGLLRMASMIEGSLGVNNIGYEVSKIAGKAHGDFTAPLLLADVLRRKTKEELWLIVPYDSPAELTRGQASASAVAVSFAVAQSLVGRSFERNVRFLYVPMAYADEQDRLDMAAQVQRVIATQGGAIQVLVLGSLLHEGKLTALTRDSGQPLLRNAADLVTASEDAEICLQGDGEFSSLLFEMNVPAALLLKKPLAEMNAEQEDSLEPGTTVLARSAADVAEVVVRLAGESQKK
jgi:hypothetical protein